MSKIKLGRRRHRAAEHGFHTMEPDKQRAIARMGGIAVHKAGTGHEFTSQEASAAGRKGVLAKRRRQKKEET